MMKSVFLHTFVVTISLGIAFGLIKLLGVESPVVMGAIALVMVALEKLVRAHPSIPISDFVNGK